MDSGDGRSASSRFVMDVGAISRALLDGLGQTMRCVQHVGEQLSPVELRSAPAAGAWSANEILWHIRAQADVYGEQIARILEHDEPRWRHVSPRARMKKARYDQLEFAESAKAFAVQREQLIARLRGLAPEAWGRFAVVRVAHRESELRLTLAERVSGMVSHEGVHCGEMEALVRGAGSR